MAVTDYTPKPDEQPQNAAMPSWLESSVLVEDDPAVPKKPANPVASVDSPLAMMTPQQKTEIAQMHETETAVKKQIAENAAKANAANNGTAAPAAGAPGAPQPAAVRQPSLGDYYRQMSASTLNQYGSLAPGLNQAEAELKAAQQQQLASYDNVPFRPLGFYEQLTKTLNPYKPPTAAEIQRRIKRERGQKTIAAIGDGISALANLWGTSQGALNAYTGTPTLSGRYADMYETLRQERKANDEKYYASYLNALAADDANAAAIRGNEATKAALNVQNAQTSYASLLGMLDKLRDRADKYDKLATDQDARDRDYELRVETLRQRAEDNAANRELRREIAEGSNATRMAVASMGHAIGHAIRSSGGSGSSGSGGTVSLMIGQKYDSKGNMTSGTEIGIPQKLWTDDKYIRAVYADAIKQMKGDLRRNHFYNGMNDVNRMRSSIRTALVGNYYGPDKQALLTIMDQRSNDF